MAREGRGLMARWGLDRPELVALAMGSLPVIGEERAPTNWKRRGKLV